ncbi:MAG TPA: hypothetical protein VEA39_00210 [Methylophilaceae bacterium]|nr:hypothetical protein [Methylophilaceae bacterium]
MTPHTNQVVPVEPTEHFPNAEFCPHCNPCRHSERLANALSLNEKYDLVLRELASYLGAGGLNDTHKLIDPKVADEKIRWGIDHIVEVERQRAAAPQQQGEPVLYARKSELAQLEFKHIGSEYILTASTRQDEVYDAPLFTQPLTADAGDLEQLYNETMLQRDALAVENDELKAKLAAAEKDKPDAERWRWYRKYRATHQDDLTPAQEEFLMETSVRQDWLAGNATTPEQLDAITDAAIAKEKE